MDPLSIAASAAGLASLTLQITQLATKLYGELKAFGPDGKALRRLASIISRISQITRRIHVILRDLDARGARNSLGSDLALEIDIALRTLEANLALVAELSDSIKNISPAKRTLMVLQRKLKSELLVELETSLTDDLETLKTFILIDLWASISTGPSRIPKELHLAIEQQATKSSDPALTDPDSGACQEDEDHDASQEAKPLKLVKAKSRVVAQERVFLSSELLGLIRHRSKKWIPTDENCGMATRTASTISIRLPYISHGIDLQYVWTQYTPLTFSLRPTHVLDPNTYGELEDVMCNGELSDLQKLLTSGKLSLYSSGRCRQGRDYSLFFLAAEWLRTDLCKWLLSQDSCGELLKETPVKSLVTHHWPKPVLRDLLNLLLNSKSDSFDIEDLAFCAPLSTNAEDIWYCLKLVRSMAPDMQQDFALRLWNHSVGAFIDDPDHILWSKIFRRLSSGDPDTFLHTTSRQNEGWLFLQCVHSRNCPLDSIILVNKWLDMWQEVGANVANYIEHETPLYMSRLENNEEPQVYPYPFPIKVWRRRYKSWSVPCWEWQTPKDAAAYELLNEFHFHAYWRVWHSFEGSKARETSWSAWLKPVEDWYPLPDTMWPLVARPIHRLTPDTTRLYPAFSVSEMEPYYEAQRIYNLRYERRYARKQRRDLLYRKKHGEASQVQQEDVHKTWISNILGLFNNGGQGQRELSARTLPIVRA